MRMTFVLVLGALRLAAIVAAVWAVQSMYVIASSLTLLLTNSGYKELPRWFTHQSTVEGIGWFLACSITAAALSLRSYRLASWIVPGAVGQCSRCGHPSGSPPGADGKVVCSECGATVVK